MSKPKVRSVAHWRCALDASADGCVVFVRPASRAPAPACYVCGVADENPRKVWEWEPRQPERFDVTDDALDAPDGAVVDGYERRGGSWHRLPSVT